MKPRTNQYKLFTPSIGLVIYFCLTVPSSVYGSDSRVMMREGVGQSVQEVLTSRLRNITGWSDLKFDANGSLRLGSSEPATGSRGARELLLKAFAGPNLIVIDDASSSSDVVFCRVIRNRWIREDASKPPVYVIQVDFSDFERVMGDKQARAAFNEGWGFLHELDHVVENSHDPSDTHCVGDGEERINSMRREMSLPERADYFFSPLPLQSARPLISRFVRLRFEQQEDSKRREYWLMWDASVVGGLAYERTIASQTSIRAYR
jgi:hypothetical protein